jgi:hypothetical protein
VIGFVALTTGRKERKHGNLKQCTSQACILVLGVLNHCPFQDAGTEVLGTNQQNKGIRCPASVAEILLIAFLCLMHAKIPLSLLLLVMVVLLTAVAPRVLLPLLQPGLGTTCVGQAV